MVSTKYVFRNQVMAKAGLENLVERFHFKVLSESMERDGWMDGMRTLVVCLMNAHGATLTMRWHDGNRGWMEKMPSGGWGILTEDDFKRFARTGDPRFRSPSPDMGPCKVTNVLTGETTEVPEGWAWDNYMEFLYS